VSTRANWYLFDYGMVISEAPTEQDWAALSEAAGLPLTNPDGPYWQYRVDYDAGRIGVAEYWQRVVGREISDGLREELHALDLRAWSNLNSDTLDVLEAIDSSGVKMALLSNMPTEMADFFQHSSVWAKYFSRLFFSGHLGLVKPEPEIYQHVLQELGASGDQVVFIDDRQENLDAAAKLGIRTVLHHPGVELASELGL
jgi:putative hydrolase of the HAD superfamily